MALEDFDNPDHMKYAQSFSDFQLDYAPDFEAAEVRIAHPELDYAGTFDASLSAVSDPRVRVDQT